MNMSLKTKNITTRPHPESRPNEVFLTNCHSWEFYEYIGWKSKRDGNVAYDSKGMILSDYFPVFVEIEEVEKAGFEIFHE